MNPKQYIKLGRKNFIDISKLDENDPEVYESEIEGYGYIPTYKRTGLTDALHEKFGFRTDTQIIKKANTNNITIYRHKTKNGISTLG